MPDLFVRFISLQTDPARPRNPHFAADVRVGESHGEGDESVHCLVHLAVGGNVKIRTRARIAFQERAIAAILCPFCRSDGRCWPQNGRAMLTATRQIESKGLLRLRSVSVCAHIHMSCDRRELPSRLSLLLTKH